MKNMLKYALGAALSMAVIAPAMAQDNFPDVPENHWAYEALAKMKREGLLVGYPDGLYRGGRPASRYEMAVAIHATYERLKGLIDGLQQQINELKGGMGGNTGGGDLAALKASVAQLESSVATMKGWGDDIANLKRMADTFQKELASLGVDVEAMKKDLADLQARVSKLEKNTFPVNIHGDANLFVMAGVSTSNRAGVTVDGRPVGVEDTIYAGGVYAPVGASQDLSVFHEAGLQLSGTNETGPKWKATLAIGNMIGATAVAGGPMAGPWAGQGGTSVGSPFLEGTTDVYFQDFVVSWEDSLMKQGFSAAIGRQGVKVSPYILMKPDNTPYYKNARWDSGEYTMDGAKFGFNFGKGGLNVFAGRTNNRTTTNGAELTPMTVGATTVPFAVGGARPVGLGGGAMVVDQMLGVTLNVPLAENGAVNLAYLFMEANTRGVGGANRSEVFGGDAKFTFGKLTAMGGYSQSNLKNGKANLVNKNNTAWNVGAGYDGGKWGLSANYREIEALFAAPGSWGRIGLWWNPTDIKGFGVKGHLDLSDRVTLHGMGQWYKGTGDFAAGLGTNDKINRFTADLGFKINDAWSAMVGGEWVEWNLAARPGFAGGKPKELWYNFGLGYHLSDNAKLNLLWQVSDYDAKGTAGFGLFATPGNAGGARATGSLITTQLSVKF